MVKQPMAKVTAEAKATRLDKILFILTSSHPMIEYKDNKANGSEYQNSLTHILETPLFPVAVVHRRVGFHAGDMEDAPQESSQPLLHDNFIIPCFVNRCLQVSDYGRGDFRGATAKFYPYFLGFGTGVRDEEGEG